MGLFDFLGITKKPYIIDDVKFCGATRQEYAKNYGDEVEYGSPYLFPKLYITINKPTKFQWLVRITPPKNNNQNNKLEQSYSYKLEHQFNGNNLGKQKLDCPGYGSNSNTIFTTPGIWTWELYDNTNNTLLITKNFYIKSPEEKWSETGYMTITDVKFKTEEMTSYVESNELSLESDAGYLYAVANYASRGYGWDSKEVELTIKIESPSGKVSLFKQNCTVKTGGGKIYLRGYGNDEKNFWYSGKWKYTICCGDNVIYKQTLNVRDCLEDCGNIIIDRITLSRSQSEGQLYEVIPPQETIIGRDTNTIYITVWVSKINWSADSVPVYFDIITIQNDIGSNRILFDFKNYNFLSILTSSQNTWIAAIDILDLSNKGGFTSGYFSIKALATDRFGQMKCIYNTDIRIH